MAAEFLTMNLYGIAAANRENDKRERERDRETERKSDIHKGRERRN